MKTIKLRETSHSINIRKFAKPVALCISLLLIISMLSAFSLTAVQAVTPTLSFGNTAIDNYVDRNDANAQSISYFKCTTTGSITDIIAYIGGASSGKAMAALYAFSGSSAGALLAQSNAVNIGTTFSWVDFQLPASYTVTSGTTYGLAILGNVAVNICINVGTGQRTGGPGYGSYAKGFANPFGTVWFNDVTGAMSIYATGSGSPVPTSTPTPVPTSTPTPVPTSTPTPVPTSTPTPVPTSTPTPVPTSTPTPTLSFGNTAIDNYVDRNDANAQSISYFKCTTTGSITDIIAYIGGASSGKAMAALYAFSGSSAGALLAQSNAVNIGTTFSWVDFQLPASYTVTSGTTYGLAILGNVAVNICINVGTGQRTGGPGYGSYAKGFANPFGTVWFNDVTGAMSIYATGSGSPVPTSTPTPVPTSTPTSPPYNSGKNFEPLSAFYSDANSYGYATVDTSTLHNGNPSIRVGPDYVRGTREVDGAWIGVHPGDHVVFSAWIKTSSFSSRDEYPGARLGMDFYVSSSQGGGIATMDAQGHQAGYPRDSDNVAGVNRVTWGNGWTLVTWDIYVPTTYYNYVTTNGVHSCNPVQINSMVGWFDARGVTENAYAWFADPSLIINP